MKCSPGISNFLKRSLVFPILLFSSISVHWSLRKAFLSLLAILWISAFRCLYLFFSPLLLFLLFPQLFVRPPHTGSEHLHSPIFGKNHLIQSLFYNCADISSNLLTTLLKVKREWIYGQRMILGVQIVYPRCGEQGWFGTAAPTVLHH